MIIYLFSYVFPAFLVLYLLGKLSRYVKTGLSGRSLLMINSCLAALAVMIPINGLPVGRWVYSLNANVSVVFTVILLHKILADYLGFDLLDKTARKTAWIFGALVGISFYPFALGIGMIDPYEWGFSFSGLFLAAMVLTLVLFYKQNRFGWALLAAILGLNLGLLESINLWDYLIDPYYFLFSMGIFITFLTKRFLSKGAHT